MYVYRNKNTGGEVTLPKPRASFEESENWERIKGETPKAAPVADAPVDPTTLADDELVTLFIGCAAVLREREGTIDDELFEAHREVIESIFDPEPEDDGESPKDKEGEAEDEDADSSTEDGSDTEVAGQTEVEATASAVKLAEEKGIDLRALTGSGDEGRIVLDDVRKAVAEKG